MSQSERQTRSRRGGGPERCSFCGRTSRERSYMHAGPGWARVCNGCVYDARAKRGEGPGRPRKCSFCGTERERLDWIYGGNMIAICNSCVDDCVAEMIAV